MNTYKFAPPPWKYVYRVGAGHEIHMPVFEVKTVNLPIGIPDEPIYTYSLVDPVIVCTACERWVQFEPKGWHEMQEANGKLMAVAPEMFIILNQVIKDLNYLDGITNETWTKIEDILKRAIQG